jgi:hypothetical protein
VTETPDQHRDALPLPGRAMNEKVRQPETSPITKTHQEGAAAPGSRKSTDAQALAHASKHALVPIIRALRQLGGQSPAGIPGQDN